MVLLLLFQIAFQNFYQKSEDMVWVPTYLGLVVFVGIPKKSSWIMIKAENQAES